MDWIRHFLSPLGPVTLASDGTCLTGLWFDGQRHFGAGLSSDRIGGNLPVLDMAAEWLRVYFGGGIPDFTPPLRLTGTPFRQAVWDALLAVPYGETVSYGELAETLSRTYSRVMGARAVGGAVGHNPVSLIVPCHRVVGAGGAVTGYAGGIMRKIRLLELERGVLG